MAETVLVGVILASGAYLLLLYFQVTSLEERLRRLVESTEQRLVDSWREVSYDYPGRPQRAEKPDEDEDDEE
ncbi:MAG: hypothetical protein RL318_643 [Fibrobacterota bacterium]|jgi:hypothetical protein